MAAPWGWLSKATSATAARRRAPHQRRRVPLCEHYQVALADQPLVEQVQLCALARAVDAFHDKELAWKQSAIR